LVILPTPTGGHRPQSNCQLPPLPAGRVSARSPSPGGAPAPPAARFESPPDDHLQHTSESAPIGVGVVRTPPPSPFEGTPVRPSHCAPVLTRWLPALTHPSLCQRRHRPPAHPSQHPIGGFRASCTREPRRAYLLRREGRCYAATLVRVAPVSHIWLA
jgi:hypothetical protein